MLKKNEIIKSKSCIQCGTCVASCYSSRETALSVRKILNEFIKSGKIPDDESALYCSTCYSCQERCPRGIQITEILFHIRRKMARKGIPEGLIPFYSSLEKYGIGVPPEDRDLKLRKKLGLENYSVQFKKEHMNEIKEIFRRLK